VQVKTAWAGINKWNTLIEQCTITRSGRKKLYKRGDYDLLFIAGKDLCWLIPWETIADKTNLWLSGPKYNDWILK